MDASLKCEAADERAASTPSVSVTERMSGARQAHTAPRPGPSSHPTPPIWPDVTPCERASIPTGLWARCGNSRCDALIYQRELKKSLQVCPRCQHHARVSARERLEQLLDPRTFREEDADIQPSDPLAFVSGGEAYRHKLAETQRKTGLAEAVVCGVGQITGSPLRVAVADFAFLGASMGTVVGEKITRAIERSIEDGLPLLAVAASGGARMHEGILALMQMAKTACALARLAEARVPFISVLTDPTMGGVTASFAGLGDVTLAEPDALIGFAGPRVIEAITREALPPEAQRAEFQLDHGMIDHVVHRRDLRPMLARLLRVYDAASISGSVASPPIQQQPPTVCPEGAPSTDRQSHASLTPWERLQLARHQLRPHTLDFIGAIFDDFVELRGDRLFADDPALVGGLARLDGQAVMVLGHQKGRDTKENARRRFGMPRPEGYRKALRLMRQAEKLGVPIITLVDTPGADPTLPSEERGQALAIATNLLEMARLKVPILTTIIGEGGSGGALAVAVADHVLMLENAVYSVVTPEGCAAILWRDAALASDAAERMKITADDLHRFGILDGIVEEPVGGAHTDPDAAIQSFGAALRHGLASIDRVYGAGSSRDVTRLIADRYKKYRRIGSMLDGTLTVETPRL
jgi:acetyl-CoA carboxylase carboxyl transferase alpha subunit/acetyl-CoA carboxylase carboxyl transferase beta subunit